MGSHKAAPTSSCFSHVSLPEKPSHITRSFKARMAHQTSSIVSLDPDDESVARERLASSL